jgi:DNA processing protein
MDELTALIILTYIPHLGSLRIRKLIQHFGSAKTALEANAAAIAEIPDFGTKVSTEWERWKKDRSWELNIQKAKELNVSIIPYYHPNYPQRLLKIPDYPIILYVQGEILPQDQRCIAVVGTRQSSVYGRQFAESIAKDLVSYGFTVVSGLARGIDAGAHEGALKGKGRTLAVIGSGLANIYPREHLLLAEWVTKQGALISEFSMLTPPDRQTFPQRNRIVSGMTMGTVLIEAPRKSGAMITVECALSQGKTIFALPGRADWENFAGNHYLIKSGQARLVENAEDVAKYYDDLLSTCQTKKEEAKPQIFGTEEEKKFLSLLPCHEISIDEIVQLTGFPVMRVNVLLMTLIMKKAIREFPGKMYKRT